MIGMIVVERPLCDKHLALAFRVELTENMTRIVQHDYN
jgi:hypothetical protein